MANEITDINGVTKREIKGKFNYYFPEAFIVADPISQTYSLRQSLDFGTTITVEFVNITEKFGASTIEDYCDELAVRGFFFDLQSTIKLNELEDLQQYYSGNGRYQYQYQQDIGNHLAAIDDKLGILIKLTQDILSD